MAYLDNTVDDATTYKGKLDESVTLVREPPVSTTSSGGTAGIDYDVADWPGTLVSGRKYYFRAHATCHGGGNVEIEGVSARTANNQNLPPEYFIENSVVAAYYDGSVLMLNAPKNLLWHNIGLIGGGDDWAQVARVTINSSNAGHIILKFTVGGFFGNSEMTASIAINGGDVTVSELYTKIDSYGNDVFRHDGIAVYESSAGVVDIYLATSTSTGEIEARFVEGITNDDGSFGWNVEMLDQQSTDTEANITGGTFDVTSQAARGEVVAEESFSIGGNFTGTNTAYAKKVRGNGGNWVTVWAPAMTHTSSAIPASGNGDLPAAYRPSEQISDMYYSNGVLTKRFDITTGGNIAFEYLDWAGSQSSALTTSVAISKTYFVPD